MVVAILYVLVSLWLSVYSLHSLYLLWCYHLTKRKRPQPLMRSDWPKVTIQLPVYNEINTIERLLQSVTALDYPKKLLQIQILDDSTDETCDLAVSLEMYNKAAGWNIAYIHRANRIGFKAGALANGMNTAVGEYIAIFDADFIPPPDFLRRCLPWFDDPKIGCVQSRWGHLNRDYSLLTRLQAMAIDAHFMVEQTARSRSGLLMNFNGSAGIWRRECVQDAGGWQSNTLTEDFDLSYRAQLKGWRFEYLPDLVVPAELPVQMTAFKQQQSRWARGSLQTARKNFLPLLKSDLPVRLKLTGILHLTHYLVHPLILVALVLSLSLRFQISEFFQWVPILMLTALISPLLYLTSPAPEAPAWPKRISLIPALTLISIGISLNNTVAALQGLFIKNEGTFERTPKYALKKPIERWETSRYVLNKNPLGLGEMVLLLLSIWGLIQAFQSADLYIIPWLLIYGAGYGLIAVITLQQSIQRIVRTS